jgi:hypothetical protein
MKPALHLVFLAVAVLAAFSRAQGAERLNPTINVNEVRLVVTYVSTGELVKLQREYGVRTDPRELRQDHHHGFSILRTNRTTGARTCEIYVPNDQRPSEVDDAGTLILGHELLHCLLGNYHR